MLILTLFTRTYAVLRNEAASEHKANDPKPESFSRPIARSVPLTHCALFTITTYRSGRPTHVQQNRNLVAGFGIDGFP